MTRNDEQRLADIRDACAELHVLVALKEDGRTPELVIQRAAERLLEIIGEAASRISDSTVARYPTVDWRGLAGLRVVLAHRYHRTDPRLVWNYVITDVPLLKAALDDDGSRPGD